MSDFSDPNFEDLTPIDFNEIILPEFELRARFFRDYIDILAKAHGSKTQDEIRTLPSDKVYFSINATIDADRLMSDYYARLTEILIASENQENVDYGKALQIQMKQTEIASAYESVVSVHMSGPDLKKIKELYKEILILIGTFQGQYIQFRKKADDVISVYSDENGNPECYATDIEVVFIELTEPIEDDEEFYD